MLKNYKLSYLPKDILAGIIVALVSIPISMGYSLVAGLPVVYGLYGSLLPILVFGIISSSPQFVFGVDAAPAALVGGTIASLGIAAESSEAMKIVPLITLVTSVWLLVFAILRVGRFVKFISTPVMGGFISGVGLTIILMQVPKLFGGKAGTGEGIELVANIIGQLDNINMLSVILSVSTITIIMVAKKYIPKFPMSVILMFVGAVISAVFHIESYGVAMLPDVKSGLPSLSLPDFGYLMSDTRTIILESLIVAIVIVAISLLSTNNYALKYGYKVNNNREIVAYCAANAVSSLSGCCPVGGSVSRTGIADQFGVKSQVMSVVAALTMLCLLLFGTWFIKYLPVPVLTGIVICALYGILEIKMAKKLAKSDRTEFLIFIAAFLGVLLLGTVYGVAIGVILSFVAVIIKAVIPPRAFLGIIPGQRGFFDLARNRNAKVIRNAVLYRFSGSLFFANINTFQEEIEAAVKEDTKCFVVDATGITNIDITAADRLVIINDKLKNMGIDFYITGHVGSVNDQLRALGAERLVEEGVVRRTASLALRNSGIDKPYPYEGDENVTDTSVIETNEQLAEIEWAFGDDADAKMEQFAKEMLDGLVESIGKLEAADNADVQDIMIKEAGKNASWGRFGLYDEDELLERIEMHLSELALTSHDAEELEAKIEQRRTVIEHKINKLNPDAFNMLSRHRKDISEYFKNMNPKAYEHMVQRRKEHIERMEKNNPELAEKFKKLYNHRDNEE